MDGITIVPLSPELACDYLYFFDNVAFNDDASVPKCYCAHFHWNEEREAEFKRSGKAGDPAELVMGGTIRGYLAYSGGVVVGWCNANDKLNYDGLRVDVLGGGRTELWNGADGDIKIKSVVCFLTAPGYRGKGIASALLERVIADARREGYGCVEGYPLIEGSDAYANHRGPRAMFERYGFIEHKKFARDMIVRKSLA